MNPQPPDLLAEKFPDLHKALYSLPKNVLKRSGRFLYSAFSTLTHGKYYLIGINPGGDLTKPPYSSQTLLSDIQKLGAKTDNAYLDENDWSTPRYQEGVKALCKYLDYETRDLCASNLIFIRGKVKEKTIPVLAQSFGYKTLYEATKKIFWPVHDQVMKIVKPECIFAIGTEDAYETMRELMGLPQTVGKRNYSGPLYYATSGEYNGRLVNLIGLPHFSHNSPDLELISKCME
ncbi:MAG: hypothetical protein FWG02_10760 [Holophagaceae bacterium]|nr:hypothetical protein [Holophagaceae bacterium]